MNSFAAAIPILIVVLSAIAAMLAEAIRQPGERMYIAGFGLIGLVGALVASCFLWDADAVSFGVVRADNFALFINIVLCIVGILTMVFSHDVVEREGMPAGEYYALTLFGLSGMMLMAAATDLLVIFLALEVLSLSVYVLTGLRRSNAAGAEAAFKYFLLGAFSSAFFLYGIAFAFTIAGSTRLDVVGTAIASGPNSTLSLLAVGLLAVGFCFKVSAVPFHMWTPDAYEGAPTIVTAFMSTSVKAAAFAAFARVFLSTLEPMQGQWMPVLGAIAGATMILGAVVGVLQNNVKRMLAYSSIAHAAGLWKSRPGLAGLMTVFLLSLGGFPPTAGFIAKWYIFSAAVQQDHYWLAIIGVLSSVVSVFFYLRIVVMMYMTEEPAAPARPAISVPAMVALGFAVLATFYLGVLPNRVLEYAMQSIQTIL